MLKQLPSRTSNSKYGISGDRVEYGKFASNRIVIIIGFKYIENSPYWRSYYPNTNGIIYVVDSVDRDRLDTTK